MRSKHQCQREQLRKAPESQNGTPLPHGGTPAQASAEGGSCVLRKVILPQFPPLFETLPFETTKLNLHPYQFCVLSEAQDMLLKISVHKNNTQFSFLVKFTVWEGEGIDGK